MVLLVRFRSDLFKNTNSILSKSPFLKCPVIRIRGNYPVLLFWVLSFKLLIGIPLPDWYRTIKIQYCFSLKSYKADFLSSRDLFMFRKIKMIVAGLSIYYFQREETKNLSSLGNLDFQLILVQCLYRMSQKTAFKDF